MGLFTDRQENLSQLKTWTNTNLSGLWPLSSKSLAKSSSQSGPIWSRRLCSRNWLPLIGLVLHSHGFIGQTHLHPIPHRSQDGQAHLRRTQEQWCCPLPLLRQLWISCPQRDAGFGAIKLVEKDANGGRRLTSQGFVILTELPRKSNKPRPKYCLKRCGKVYHL